MNQRSDGKGVDGARLVVVSIDGGGGGSRSEGREGGEHERAILGLFFVLVIGLRGREINARTALQRCEECSRHAHPEPPGQAVDLLVRR